MWKKDMGNNTCEKWYIKNVMWKIVHVKNMCEKYMWKMIYTKNYVLKVIYVEKDMWEIIYEK